jgi:hypothetical protein
VLLPAVVVEVAGVADAAVPAAEAVLEVAVEAAAPVEVGAATGVAAAPGPVDVGAAAAATAVTLDVAAADTVEVGPVAAVTLVGVAASARAVGPDVAADCATGPVNSGGGGWRPTTPCVTRTARSNGTSPTAGTSHHQRQAGAVTPRVDRTACVVRRGCGGL